LERRRIGPGGGRDSSGCMSTLTLRCPVQHSDTLSNVDTLNAAVRTRRSRKSAPSGGPPEGPSPRTRKPSRSGCWGEGGRKARERWIERERGREKTMAVRIGENSSTEFKPKKSAWAQQIFLDPGPCFLTCVVF